MKLDLTKFDHNIRPGHFKVFFTIEDFGEEFYQVIPGPLVNIHGDISDYDRFKIPAVADFCNRIINGIQDGSINIPQHIMTDFARLNKAERKIMCSDKEIGNIYFGRVYSYHAYDLFNDGDDTLNAIRFGNYLCQHTVTNKWYIQFNNVEQYHIATVPDTDDIEDILAPMIKDMNRYYR